MVNMMRCLLSMVFLVGLLAALMPVGSGQRIPFMSGRSMLFTAELPQAWVCNCMIGSHRLENVENPDDWLSVSLARRAADADLATSLSDAVAADLGEDETLLAQESAQAGDREVLIVTIEDAAGSQRIKYL